MHVGAIINRSFDKKLPLDSGAYHRVRDNHCVTAALRIWTATKDVCNCSQVMTKSDTAKLSRRVPNGGWLLSC